MAEEYGVKLKVTADTAEAEASMDQLLDRKARRVQDATGAGGESAAPGGVSADSARKAGRAAGQEFERTVSGGAAGKAIGKALAGFALHQGLGTAFEFARTPGADNTSVSRAQSTISGALQFGTAGAMLGGPAGAVVGAALGGAFGLAQQLARERQERRETRIGMWQTAWQNSEGLLAGFGSEAQRRLLGWQGSREARIEWLTANRRDLQARQKESADRLAAFSGDKTSTEYTYLQGEYQRLGTLYNRAVYDEMQERMSPLYDPYTASEFSDAFSRRGLTVGPSVDVASANGKVIELQERMVDLLQRIVDTSNAGAAANSERLTAVLRDIFETTGLQ